MEPFDVEAAFRRHRHDVMNRLQLVRAYAQIGKPDKVVAVVDDLADWMNNLSRVQGCHWNPEWLWTAAQCHLLRFDGVGNGADPAMDAIRELCQWMLLVQEAVSEQGSAPIRYRLEVQNTGHIVVSLADKTNPMEEMAVAWHTVHKSMQTANLTVHLEMTGAQEAAPTNEQA